MAGLSKEALAAKAAFTASKPEKEWKDLTEEEKAPWFNLPADQEPYGDSQVDPDDLKKLPSGQVVDAALIEDLSPPVAPVPASSLGQITPATVAPPSSTQPATDPEHGDLTPAYAQWYLAKHGREAFNEKYSGRFDFLPADLIGGAA